MSQTHAVFLHADGSAEVREVRLDERDRPPRFVQSKTRRLGAVADFELTPDGVEYPIYREVTP